MPKGKKFSPKSATRRTTNKPRSKTAPMNEKLQEVIDRQHEDFVEKFGREPGPGDPVLFDPDIDTPTPFEPERIMAGVILAMIHAGSPEHLIYAYIRTGGMIVTDDTWGLWPEEDRELWRLAIREYEQDFGKIDDS